MRALETVWQPWLNTAHHLLDIHRDSLNAMNLFPVPDSDTGSNMLATISAAKAEQLPLAGAESALQAARGNSGILLAVWLKALVSSLGTGGQLTPESLHVALWSAAYSAREAVSKPVEGTLLTAMDAVGRAEIAGELDEHLVYLAETAALAAYESKKILAEARAADIADAGAVGFFFLINALSITLGGCGLSEEKYSELLKTPAPSKLESGQLASWGFEVMCEVEANAASMAQLRDSLEGIGDSVVIVRAQEGWAIHVHVSNHALAVAAIKKFGTPQNLRISSLETTPSTAHEV